jgi:hypothetical protein
LTDIDCCPMTKDKLKQNLFYVVQLHPLAIRVDQGSVNDDWRIEAVADSVKLKNIRTEIYLILGFDHIHSFSTNPARDWDGNKHGFLDLNVQVFFDNKRSWVQPIRIRRPRK